MNFQKILYLCLLLIPCIVFSTEKTSNSNLETVKLQLKWYHSFQFAGYYAAKEQGYYKKEGLDVEIIERSSDASVATQVISSQVDYGIEASGILLQYAKGKPVKALAAIFQHSPLIFISKQSSEITSPHEMINKRIMLDGANQAVLKALLYDADISNQQYIDIRHSFNPDDLITDQTDVISAYITNEPFYYQNKNLKINIINPRNYGFDFYGDFLFTSKNEILNYPGRAERFRRASLKGWAYALKHPEQLIQLIHTQYHSTYSIDRLRFEAKQISKLIAAEHIPLGQIKTTRLRRIADTYRNLKLITHLTDSELKNFIYDSQLDLKLSAKELQWLIEHPVIHLGIDRDFAPHEWIDEKGIYTGHAADYMKLLEKRLNIKFNIIKDKSWPDIIEMAKRGELDMLSDVISTPERQLYLDFTVPYINNPAIIINDVSYAYIGQLKNLHHKKVAIEKGYSLNELLAKEHPEIIIVPAKSTRHALGMVSRGLVSAYIGDAATANYTISQTGLLNLRFSGQSGYVARHSIGTIKSHPLLSSIMDKALASITQKEKMVITNRWLGLVIKQGINVNTILKYIAVILILFLLFAYWIFSLHKEVSKRQAIEINLRQTQKRFVKSQHSADFGIWDLNIASKQLYWSETVPPLFGYEAAEQEKADFSSYLNTIHPDDRELVKHAIQYSIDNHHSYKVEHRVIWPDKSIHWLQESGDIILDDKGNTSQLIGIVRDITQRKLTEDVLQTLAESDSSEKENILRLIVRKLAISQNVSQALIAQIRPQNAKYIDTLAVWNNDKYIDNFSYRLAGTPCEKAISNGYYFSSRNIQKLFPGEHLLIKMDTQGYMGITLKDKRQNVIGLLALIDSKPIEQKFETKTLLKSLATRAAIELERKKTEQSIELAALVYQSSSEAMLITDSNNQIIAINPAFTKITGYSEQHVLGKNPNVLSSGRHDANFYKKMWQQITKKGYWQGEILNKRKDGTKYTEWITINTIYDESGAVQNRVALFSDITKNKQTEEVLKEHRNRLQTEVKLQTKALEDAKNEAIRANHAKSDFLANMSHELRTPMHGILSFTRLGIKNIERGQLDKLAKYFDRINISAERLLVLLNDLLDLSKLEAHKMGINKNQYNLYSLVQDSIAEQEALLKDKQLNISWGDIYDESSALFDKARIAQVITNLLSNAIKFSPPNKNIFISITRIQLSNQPALNFMIEDEGTGIPEQELKNVFNKFIQSSKTSTNAGGTGLGLAICQEIITVHQGRVWAENSSKGGAVFQFTIPIYEQHNQS
ncbi:MAG: ABC transporter substrate-binding protein [Methylococcales bacterium]|nr:ABC transporter substrate-binding protein [Methylococcales bacterium]